MMMVLRSSVTAWLLIFIIMLQSVSFIACMNYLHSQSNNASSFNSQVPTHKRSYCLNDYPHISIPEDDNVQSITATPSFISCDGRQVDIGGYEPLGPLLSKKHGGTRKGSEGDTQCTCNIL
eukprot:182824_1